MSGAEGTICRGFAVSHHVVYGKNLPRPDDVYIAFDNHNSMVHLAWSDVQDTLDVTENQAAGCWAILGVVVKCRVLLLRRMCVQVRKEALQRQRA